MEQIIPILIAAIVFGFQAYQNYQKEQEKARKRNPGQRPPQQHDEERPVTTQTRQPRPALMREHQTPAQQPIPIPEEAPILDDYQEYAGFINEDQLVQLTKKRNTSSQHDLLKPLEITDDDEDIEVSEGAFDLRAAVIHTTILERPYQ